MKKEMKMIKLNTNQTVKIDDEDYPYLKSFNWTALRSGQNTYAVRYSKGVTYYMHRVVTDAPSGDRTLVVDHKDNDGLNNTKKNLRVVTQSANLNNCRNRRIKEYVN